MTVHDKEVKDDDEERTRKIKKNKRIRKRDKRLDNNRISTRVS